MPIKREQRQTRLSIAEREAFGASNMVSSKVNRANIESVPQGGFYLHWQMASCDLSTSNRFPYLKTTCPCGENASEVSVFLTISDT